MEMMIEHSYWIHTGCGGELYPVLADRWSMSQSTKGQVSRPYINGKEWLWACAQCGLVGVMADGG